MISRSVLRPWVAPVLVAASVLAVGCNGSSKPAARRPSQGRASQQGATALLGSIKSQLRTLPESALMELAPPMVVLDARSTTNGEDIQGIARRRTGVTEGPANVVAAVSRNIRFTDKAAPGDVLKYYAKYDRETLERIKATAQVDERTGQIDESTADIDVVTYDSYDFRVAQVLSETELLIEGGFPIEDGAPRKVEIWRIADQRMNEIQRQWSEYVSRREPALAWHPSPDEAAIHQLSERLNQWLRQVRLAGKNAETKGWERPELLGSLPDELAGSKDLAPFLSDDDLATGYFRPYESRCVQGSLWARDIARWARGAESSPLAVARSLFDWTVRNLQLIDDSPPRWPWEMVLIGQATAEGRAWVFAELCLQQNLDAAVVTLPGADDAESRTLVGVLVDGSLKLFDPVLGLPIPGADGVASLADVQQDDSLLRALDLPDAPYPVTADAAAEAAVGVVASPLSLTRRAKAFSGQLTAEDAVRLSVDADATAERIGAAAGVGSVGLWDAPFQMLVDKLNATPSQRRRAVREFLPFAWRPPLWRGRLQHFRGIVEDESKKRGVLEDALNDHRAARQYYMDRSVRPPDERLANIADEKREIYLKAKSMATLFLSTLSYDQGSYGVSQRWLENSALQSEAAEPYRAAVAYNLARTYEALGEADQATEVFESVEGPMAAGAKLRAELLRQGEQAAAETDAP